MSPKFKNEVFSSSQRALLCVQSDTKAMSVSLILTKLLSFKFVKLSEAEIAKMPGNAIQN